MRDVSFEWIPPAVNQTVSTKESIPSPIKDNSMIRELSQEPSTVIAEGDSITVEEPSKRSFSQFPPLRSSQTLSRHAPAHNRNSASTGVSLTHPNSTPFAPLARSRQLRHHPILFPSLKP